MDVFAGGVLFFAVVVLGFILAAVLVVLRWTTRARNIARLEMKRHVQEIETTAATTSRCAPTHLVTWPRCFRYGPS